MAESFDPYYKWLGIPPNEQPPNHYRLLGVSQFESNEDVIANAADQRMSYLRGFQSGQQATHCQKLLNEVSNAKLTLLSPQKKSAYDQSLRSAASTGKPDPGKSGPKIPLKHEATGVPRPRQFEDPATSALEEASAFESGFDEHAAPPLSPQPRPPKSGPSLGLMLGIGGAVVAVCFLCCAGGLVYSFSGLRRTAQPRPNPQRYRPPPTRPPRPTFRPPTFTPPPRNNPRTNSTRTPPANETLRPVTGTADLVSYIDLKKDVLRGDWKIEDGNLICHTQHFVPRLLTGYFPPEEFDAYIEYEQPKVRNHVGVSFPHKGTYYVLGAGHNRQDPKPTPSERHQLRFEVRTGHFKVYFDDQLVHDGTDISKLTVDSWHRVPDERRMSIFCDDPTTFYEVKVVPITGTGQTNR